MARRANPEFFISKSLTDKLDLSMTPWPDEVKANFAKLNRDPQLRLLIGPVIPKLVDRALHAPRIEGPLWIRASGVGRNLVDHPEEEGWLVDVDTGDVYVFEDGPGKKGWFKQVQPPEGAFTYGELMLLDYELTRALERLADAAEAGALTAKQRKLAGTELGEAADNVGLRLHLHNLHTTPEEAKALKRSILEYIAERDVNPSDEWMHVPKGARRAYIYLQPAKGDARLLRTIVTEEIKRVIGKKRWSPLHYKGAAAASSEAGEPMRAYFSFELTDAEFDQLMAALARRLEAAGWSEDNSPIDVYHD